MYLEETLKAQGKIVALFTSRRIKDLVQVNENDLFFGESAKESNGKKMLIKELENSGTIDKFVKKSYSSYSDFKDNSFCANYFIKRNVNKIDAFVSIFTPFFLCSERKWWIKCVKGMLYSHFLHSEIFA